MDLGLDQSQMDYTHATAFVLTEEQKEEIVYQSIAEELAQTPFTNEELRFYRSHPDKFVEWELHFYTLTYKQKRFLKSFVRFRKPYTIIKSARGTGKTFLLSMLVVWLTVCFHDFQICIVSGSFEQSLILYSYCMEWVHDNPRIHNYLVKEPSRVITIFQNGSWFKCLTASERQVRGPHPNALIVDEAVLVKPSLYKSAIGMLGDRKPMLLVVSSTPQNDVGIILFRDLWDNPDFAQNQVHWTAYDCPWKDKEEIKRKRRQMTKDEFLTDILGEFSSITGSIYDLEDVLASRISYLPQRDTRFFAYMGIDWGRGAHTFVTIIQKNFVKHCYEVLWAEHYPGWKFVAILKRVSFLYEYFDVNQIYADSSHESENERLEDIYNLNVSRVAFGKQVVPKTKTRVERKTSIKEVMIRNSKEKFELQLLRVPSRDFAITMGLSKPVWESIPLSFDILIKQCVDYHRDDMGRVVKENDHGVDSMQCALFGHMGGTPVNVDMEIAEMDVFT